MELSGVRDFGGFLLNIIGCGLEHGCIVIELSWLSLIVDFLRLPKSRLSPLTYTKVFYFM